MTPLQDGLMHAWARWYFEQGWPVFPVWPVAHKGDQWLDRCSCRRGNECTDACKHPRITDFEGRIPGLEVDMWWSRNPTSNIAIRCDSLTVIDLDGPEGSRAFRDLREKHGAPPPDTPTVRTGGGGFHLYFKAAPGVHITNKTRRLPGVDVRVNKGYVLAPPSRTLKGGYEWVKGREPWEVPLMDLPDWLADAISEPEPMRAKGREAFPPGDPWEIDLETFDEIYEGARNDGLVSVCGKLFNAYSGRDSIPYYEVAGKVEKSMLWVNQNRVKPPVPRGEISNIIRKMVRRDERRRK